MRVFTYIKNQKFVYLIINRIGQFISTKAVGKWEREDITLDYKYAESKLLKFLKISSFIVIKLKKNY